MISSPSSVLSRRSPGRRALSKIKGDVRLMRQLAENTSGRHIEIRCANPRNYILVNGISSELEGDARSMYMNCCVSPTEMR
ncbi:hypothetical protein PILCRDRAFT_829605 [Piloderma croceum F 1598]|uniref:Uncharacterized protein n=1 Tax=Piloderma croceum (strain F 1598) TaxID=765440 RepID=A0A0C3B5Z8_PILCF|nr:hypothetical protein PILCRDRAFT_829605 [Piloderma croceum F 1598]